MAAPLAGLAHGLGAEQGTRRGRQRMPTGPHRRTGPRGLQGHFVHGVVCPQTFQPLRTQCSGAVGSDGRQASPTAHTPRTSDPTQGLRRGGKGLPCPTCRGSSLLLREDVGRLWPHCPACGWSRSCVAIRAPGIPGTHTGGPGPHATDHPLYPPQRPRQEAGKRSGSPAHPPFPGPPSPSPAARLAVTSTVQAPVLTATSPGSRAAS